MSRWFVPERLVRAYKSQPEAVTSSRKKRGVPTEKRERERERRHTRRTRREEKRKKTRARGRERERDTKGRSVSHKAFHQLLFMESALIRETREEPERKSEPKDRAKGNAARRGPVLGIPNSTKPSKNSRKVPFTRLGPGISLAPFPGTPGARGLV